MTSFDDLIDALAEAGVHEGFPFEQRRLASQLMSDGITAAAVQSLAAQVARSCRRPGSNKAAVLCAILVNPRRRSTRLAGIERTKAAKAKAVVAATAPLFVPPPTPPVPYTRPPEYDTAEHQAKVERMMRDFARRRKQHERAGR